MSANRRRSQNLAMNRSTKYRTSRNPLAVAAVAWASLFTLVVGVVVTAAPVPVSAQTNAAIVVNSTEDRSDSSGSDGVCRTSAGTCTFRAAVQQANYNAGSDTIRFNISGSGTKTITVGSTITINDIRGGVTIDGYTQSDASPNTASSGSNARIRIQLRSTRELTPMLLVESAENTIRGLSMYGGSGTRLELRGENADGNKIVGNFIGTNATGSSTSVGTGIEVNLGPDQNLIGTADRADRNVVSGNGNYGIRINHGETSQNTVENNIVGLNPSLSNKLPQGLGIDLQWWTWGNYVVGNLVGGNTSAGGIDLSHSSTGNAVIGNYIGTRADGNSDTSYTANSRGLSIKDNPVNNYIADNVIGGSTKEGVWHKHNYSGSNTFVNNRIGVGVNGGDIGNRDHGIILTGHDDLYHGNIIGNNGDAGIYVSNTSDQTSAHRNYPDEKTIGNVIRQGTFYGQDAPHIDIEARGHHSSDSGDNDDGAHTRLNPPAISGLGRGQINGTVCDNCEVEIYLSGSIQSDGTIDASSSSRGYGATWIGRTVADGNGRYSMSDSLIIPGKYIYAVAIDGDGNTSEMSRAKTVPSSSYSLVSSPNSNLGARSAPAAPSRPALYQPASFDCSFNNGTLSWDNENASEYYVWSIADGQENYLGPVGSTSISAPAADSYRVQHWTPGYSVEGECAGGGVQNATFSCSTQGTTLTWENAGAAEYYVWATTGGVERYLGAQSGTQMSIAGADSYRVQHWASGSATETDCAGGGSTSFTCSYSNGSLIWADAGAAEYYVFATTNGVESYLGGHQATSLAVTDADSFRVQHWLTGSATETDCAGGTNSGFACLYSNGTLSWNDAGASEYYVFATTNGVESYLGGHSTISLAVNAADSYRVEHWADGAATNATCPGAGVSSFACSYSNGVLSWSNAGAPEYYVFATENGLERYLGGHSSTSLSVDPATSYRVEHWISGQTNATC